MSTDVPRPAGRGRAIFLGCVAFATSFGAHVVAVNLPVYAREAGIGLAMIGALIAVYDFAEVIAKPVFGVVADRAGLKRTMLLGIVIFCLASLAYLVLPPRLLIVVRFLQGIGAAGLSILSAALIASCYGENRGEAYGIYNAIKGAGYVVSPLIGGAIVAASSFRMIFVASFAAGLIALLLSLLLPNPSTATDLDDDDDLSPRQFLQIFRERALLPWYLVIVVNMFLVGILFGFVPVYVHALGYGQLENGLIVSAAAVAYLLIQPIAGRIADRVLPARVVLIGLLLSSCAVAAVPFTTGFLLVLTVLVAGAGVGTVWTNSDMMVSRLAREQQIGAALGAAGSFKEIGDMLGPLAVGFLAQQLGLRVAFVACGVASLATIAVIRTGKAATAKAASHSA